MKIYNKIVIDIKTGAVIEEISFEYFGPIAETKGGGSVQTEDKEYNARMATISEEQQEMATQMYNHYMYGVDYDPNEQVTGYYDANGRFVEAKTYDPSTGSTGASWLSNGQYNVNVPEGASLVSITRGELNNYDPEAVVSEMDLMDKQIQDAFGLSDDETESLRSKLSLETSANTAAESLIPAQTELEHARISGASSLVPAQTELEHAQISAASSLVPAQTEVEHARLSGMSPIIRKYYEAAGKDINVNDRMNEASADVAQSAGAARDSMGRNIALRGGNINSGYGRSMMKDLTSDTMKADAFARTGARRDAETEQLERYRSALTLGDF